MRVLLVGDIYGRPGREMLRAHLPGLRRERALDLVVANGENAAAGFGLTPGVYEEIRVAGVDVVTLGNHTWDKREVVDLLEREERCIRPLNYPPGTPGHGVCMVEAAGQQVLVVNAMGRVFSPILLECPFRGVDAALRAHPADVVLVDFHAEATSEKEAMGWYLDGRATAVVGTHTHVQTADERVLPGGTAYLTDLGMTGPGESVLGVDRHIIIERFLTQRPARFTVAEGRRQFNALLVTADANGKATEVERIFIRE